MKRNIAWGLAGFGLINFILIIISLGTDEWIVIEAPPYILRISIWTNDIEEKLPGLRAVQAFMILASIATSAAIVFTALLSNHLFTRKVFAEAFFSVAGIFLLIAVIVFTSEFNQEEGYFGYSFVLACVCVVFSFILSGAVELLEKYD